MRASGAILICILACCTINYYRPHKNVVILSIDQIAFLLSSVKYLVAIIIQLNEQVALPGENKSNQNVFGYFLIGTDVLFICFSVCAAVAIVCMLKTMKMKPTTAADQLPVTVPEHSHAHVYAALKLKKNINSAAGRFLPRGKSKRTLLVENIQNQHSKHRDEQIKAIKNRQLLRRSSVHARVEERKKKTKKKMENNADQQTGGIAPVFPELKTVVFPELKTVVFSELKLSTDVGEAKDSSVVDNLRKSIGTKIKNTNRFRKIIRKIIGVDAVDGCTVVGKGKFLFLTSKLIKKIETKMLKELWKSACKSSVSPGSEVVLKQEDKKGLRCEVLERWMELS